MEANLLLSCSIKVLALLVRLYEEGNMTAGEFEKNGRLKAQFILEHMDHIEGEKEKELAAQVLGRYFGITADCHIPLFDCKTGR